MNDGVLNWNFAIIYFVVKFRFLINQELGVAGAKGKVFLFPCF